MPVMKLMPLMALMSLMPLASVPGESFPLSLQVCDAPKEFLLTSFPRSLDLTGLLFLLPAGRNQLARSGSSPALLLQVDLRCTAQSRPRKSLARGQGGSAYRLSEVTTCIDPPLRARSDDSCQMRAIVKGRVGARNGFKSTVTQTRPGLEARSPRGRGGSTYWLSEVTTLHRPAPTRAI